VTVAAEQGLIGLAAYLAVLVAALRALLGNRLGAMAARAPPLVDGGVAYPARAAVAAMFCALVVHTMAYAAFLEDPFSWVLMALGISLAPSASLVPARLRSARRAEASAAAREGRLAPRSPGLSSGAGG
jgi:O-antigen ligase